MNKLFLLLVCFGITALGLPSKEVPEVSVYYQKNGAIQSKTFQYADLKLDLEFRAKSPHGMLNPEGKVNHWKGISLKSLFAEAGVPSFGPKEEVAVIGADGYQAQLYYGDFFNPEAMIALKMDEHPILPSKGGPQIFFNHGDPHLSNELRFEGWGVWYVSGIIVGKLEPKITFKAPRQPAKVVSMPQTQLDQQLRNSNVPSGHYRAGFNHQKVNFGSIPLAKFLNEHTKDPFSKVIVATYYGDSITLKDWSDFELVLSWNGKPIPPKYGGPVQLCPKDKPANCTYFVKAITLEG